MAEFQCCWALINLHNSDKLFLPSQFTGVHWLRVSASLLCSVEKPTHAHRDQLFHCESLSGGCAGDHHLPAGQPRGGHHGDVVLWTNPLQNCALPTGRTFTFYVWFSHLETSRAKKDPWIQDETFLLINTVCFHPEDQISKQTSDQCESIPQPCLTKCLWGVFSDSQLHCLWYVNLKEKIFYSY